VFTIAAGRGLTAICAYLQAEHCPWSAMTCHMAAIKGHHSILQWLCEHGCPWDYTLWASAAQGGSIDVIAYLQQQQQQQVTPTAATHTAELQTMLLRIAGAYSKLAVVKWLRQQGAEWPTLLHWLQPWSGDALAWARAEGCTSPIE
jgi:hypothetical protein